ncbi:MAG: Rrf2 family transcriptional regulator [Bacteriovoracia bacterium]
MLKLNRTTEYGLLAISYLRNKPSGKVSSAREIADHFALPFEILAKTLQKLKESGVISANYGTRGGYSLSRDLTTLKLSEFLDLMEGPVAVVACTQTRSCEYDINCTIKHNIEELNSKIYEFLSRISVEELTRAPYNNATQQKIPTQETVSAQPSVLQEAVSFDALGEEP